MALKRFHDAVPDPASGLPPDRPAEITPALIRHWASIDDADRTREFAHPDARIRHSWSGKCSRALGYLLTGTEESDPLTEPDYYRFAIGKMGHDFWQGLVVDVLSEQGWTDIKPEAKVYGPGHISAGHADLLAISPEGRRTVVELKTINGFGFKNILGLGPDQVGPRSGDLLQAAMNALAAEADDVRMIYLAMELISPGVARKAGLDDFSRFCAEWTITRETWEPLAIEERGRWETVLATVDAGLLPPRQIPDPRIPAGALIADPATGRWDLTNDSGFVVDSGRTWHCDYCSFRHQCQSDS